MGLVYRTLLRTATAPLLALVVACSTATAPPPAPAAAAASGDPDDGPLVVFLGDSLTAGYGLDAEQAFPARIAATLADEGRPVRVVNAGISGDTSAGGLARLDWLLRQGPDLLVVALGANDGLRGQPPDATAANLREIVRRAKDSGAKVLLVGMRIPPSYGLLYTREFEAVFPAVAKETGVPLMPFLLEGVAAKPEFNFPDGLHPNAEGQRVVAADLIPYVRDLIR